MKITTAVILIVAVIIAIFIIVLGDQNTSGTGEQEEVVADTSSWQSYNNTEFDISLSHPKDWEVVEALKPTDLRAVQEIVVWKSNFDEVFRPSLSIFVFPNEDKFGSINDWWAKIVSEEEQKEEDCREEYGEESPCLFLHDRVVGGGRGSIAEMPSLEVRTFEFDSEKECQHILHKEYVVGVCYGSENPNDPNFEENNLIYRGIRDSVEFK